MKMGRQNGWLAGKGAWFTGSGACLARRSRRLKRVTDRGINKRLLCTARHQSFRHARETFQPWITGVARLSRSAIRCIRGQINRLRLRRAGRLRQFHIA